MPARQQIEAAEQKRQIDRFPAGARQLAGEDVAADQRFGVAGPGAEGVQRRGAGKGVRRRLAEERGGLSAGVGTSPGAIHWVIATGKEISNST